MNKIPFIITAIGIVIFMTFKNIEPLGMIGIIIFVGGLFACLNEVYKKEKLDLIKIVNSKLDELDFTKEEIDNRQDELKNSSRSELKSLVKECDNKIERKKKEDFFEPIDRKNKIEYPKILKIDPKGNIICIDKTGRYRTDLNSYTLEDEKQIEVFGKILLTDMTIEHGGVK
ncbi:TPA: hypothetical protein RU529_002595 [Staphylococcus aureus]|nr:hypothetical protein [Staphylococcus aureus]HEA0030411.1 hypothetical protein [Staphylococcus aureus]HEA0052020.1 hypothetical protein [Staphylococcus aureus]HEA0065408.1 hypothetical protein [Staphylococcus aureus]HEA0070791.1 hypothetical protein [Staphylococcus aureus]